MRKGLLLGAFLLGAASFSMLTGFDSAATAEDVMQKYMEASRNTKEVAADADMTLDADMTVPAADMTLGLTGSLTEKVGVTMEPFGMQADTDFNFSVFGENISGKVEVYGITEEDGSFSMYTKTDMGDGEAQWAKTSTSSEEIQKLMDMAMSGKFDLSTASLPFELASAPVDVNGIECYELSASMTVSDLLLMLQPVFEQLGEEASIPMDDINSIGSMLSGIQINVSLDVDTEGYLPQKIHMDLDGSDWTMVAALLGSFFGSDDEGNPYEVSLSVNALSMDIVYDYETPVEIVLPADAAGAEEIGADASSLLEMVEDAAA